MFLFFCFFCILVALIQTKSLLCGTDLQNFCWERSVIHQPQMFGAVGKAPFTFSFVCNSHLTCILFSLYIDFFAALSSKGQGFQRSLLNIYFFNFIYFFVQTGDGREKEKERNINVWLPLAHPHTGDLACNPLVHRLALNPLSHTSQGRNTSLTFHQLSFYFF